METIKETSKFMVFIKILSTKTLVIGFMFKKTEKHEMVGKCKGD